MHEMEATLSCWPPTSKMLKKVGPPLTDPAPLHLGHAIILRPPRLLHNPKELHSNVKQICTFFGTQQ
ncbi:hypothetical protein Scep_012914 [Stephania cephalantha]|uniref:Uncharacterized protein n=1 Tax=Stephania cephalantha TaxID=152367 RepID=A0AAP0JG09_9MAGN